MLLISMLFGMLDDAAGSLVAVLRHAQNRLNQMVDKAIELGSVFVETALREAGLDSEANAYRQHLDSFRRDEVAAGESVTQLVTVGATLFIGIVVLASIGDAMPNNVSMFSGAMDQAETILNSSFILAAILPLVIIAAALLFYVRRFNRDSGGGNGR